MSYARIKHAPLSRTQNWQSISKKSAPVAQHFFSKFFSKGTDNPALIGHCHMVPQAKLIPDLDVFVKA
jgi:hypothetical protein